MHDSLVVYRSHLGLVIHGKMKQLEKIGGRSRVLLMLACVVLLLNGCATVPSVDETGKTPFQSFSESVLELHQGTDQALANIVTMSTQRYMREALRTTAAGDTTKIEQLRINIPEDPSGNIQKNVLSWSPAPLFMYMEQFREGAKKSTGILVTYSQFIERIASPELLPKETFDTLAEELNSNAYDAISTIKNKPPDEENVALFSTAAIEIARIYLESQRRSELLKALKANQSTVETFAAQMQSGVEIAALALWNEYDEKSQLYFNSMVTSSGIAAEPELRKAIQDLITLDSQHIQNVSRLYSLHQAFGQIPNAHAELTTVLENPKLSMTAIITLFEAGARLGSTYKQALASNKAQAAQAIADKATAQADMLEAEAENAQLRASSAKVRAVKAKAEAEDDPSNEGKKSRVVELEKSAQELQEEADRKKARAVEAQLAAGEAQNQAIKIKNELLNVGG
jgi:hypothetical protein